MKLRKQDSFHHHVRHFNLFYLSLTKIREWNFTKETLSSLLFLFLFVEEDVTLGFDVMK